jgi:chitodextrinase
MGFQGQYMKAGWSESSVTWNNANYLGGTPLPVGSLSSSIGWKSGNMTDQVRAWHSGSQANNGVIVTGDEGPERNRSRNLFSRQQTNTMPYIVVDFTTSCDTVPPTATVEPLPTWSQEDFVVIWNGFDSAQSGCSPSGIAYYDVQYSKDSNNWVNWKTGTTGNSATFKGGANGSSYQFRARAVDRAGNVQAWTGAQASTNVDSIDPSASVLPLPEFTLTEVFIVNWSGTDNLSGIANYDVQWRELNGEWNWMIQNTPQTSFQVTGADSGVTYQFRARATDTAGNVQPWGDAQAQTTVITRPFSEMLPIVPSTIKPTSPVTDSFELNWHGLTALGTITKYDIWFQYDNGSWQLWNSFPGTVVSATFEYLAMGLGDGLYNFESVATNSLDQVELRTETAEAQVLVDLADQFKPNMYLPIIVKQWP